MNVCMYVYLCMYDVGTPLYVYVGMYVYSPIISYLITSMTAQGRHGSIIPVQYKPLPTAPDQGHESKYKVDMHYILYIMQ